MIDQKNVCKAFLRIQSASEALAVAHWKNDEWQLGRAVKDIREAAAALGFDVVERRAEPEYPDFVECAEFTAGLDSITVGKG